MRLKSKEKAKLDSRRKLWSLFGWTWAYKRNEGGEFATDWTSDKHESLGYGCFKKNHSLNCGCFVCKIQTEEKRHKKKIKRIKNKNEVRDILKLVNVRGDIEL